MPICNANFTGHHTVCTLSLNIQMCIYSIFYSISIFDGYYLEKFSLNVKGLDLFEVIIISFIYKL